MAWKVPLASVLLFVLFGSPETFAQVREGDVEINFRGALGHGSRTSENASGEQDSDSTGISLFGGAGYFVTPHWDIGGNVSVNYFDLDDGDQRFYSIGPAVNYHFKPEHHVVPFVGVMAGYSYNKLDASVGSVTDDGWVAAVRGGVDVFLTKNVAIKVALEASHRETDRESNFGVPMKSTDEVDEIATTAGLAIFFGRK